MLQQELLVALDGLARREPEKLKGTLTLQLGQLLLLLTSELAAEHQLSQDEAFETLCSEAPHAISLRLQALLNDVDHAKELSSDESYCICEVVCSGLSLSPSRNGLAVAIGYNIENGWALSNKSQRIFMPESGLCFTTVMDW